MQNFQGIVLILTRTYRDIFKSALVRLSLCEKCPNTDFFLVRISGLNTKLNIQSECGKIQTKKNSVFGHFSCSV